MSRVDPDKIAARAAGARQFAELLNLIEFEKASEEFQFGFRRAMREFLGEPEQIEIKRVDRVMTTEQARRFEATPCPYSKYKGLAYGVVPVGYLDFIGESVRELQAYLKSERAAARRDLEPEDEQESRE